MSEGAWVQAVGKVWDEDSQAWVDGWGHHAISLVPEIRTNVELQSTLGVCYASATQNGYTTTSDSYQPYHVWSETLNNYQYWSNYGTGDTICRCGFKFNTTKTVTAMALYSNYMSFNLGTYKYQYSTDGQTWIDITDVLPASNTQLVVTEFNTPVSGIYFVAKGVSKTRDVVISNMRIFGY